MSLLEGEGDDADIAKYKKCATQIENVQDFTFYFPLVA